MKCTNSRILLLLLAGLSSCGIIKDTPKYQLDDGFYKSNIFKLLTNIVYVSNTEDTVFIYYISPKTKNPDTVNYSKRTFPQVFPNNVLRSNIFKQASFDIDFLTIPFKYRPAQKDFPRQFNTNLNGVVYLGYRNDIYQLRYKNTMLKKYQRQTWHYGFSFGLFTGLGGTTMNPSVTNNHIVTEYDGVVWSKGVAGIIGVNNFTIGLAVGFDDLLDNNKKIWLYQRKPWIGFAFGLNLN